MIWTCKVEEDRNILFVNMTDSTEVACNRYEFIVKKLGLKKKQWVSKMDGKDTVCIKGENKLQGGN